MIQQRNARFELHPLPSSALPEVAEFLRGTLNNELKDPLIQKPLQESVSSIERRLKWLLIDNPVANPESPLGYSLRDTAGVIRGISLCFPAAFLSADTRLLGLCSGSFFVEPAARSLGFYLFKKCLSTPGYAFYFASSCNTNSSELWKSIGGSPVPNSETEYILPLKLDSVIAAYVAYRTSNQVAAGIARTCGRGVNPILRLLTRTSSHLTIEPCQDWEKLAELSSRHRSPDHVTSHRSAALLQWRYGPKSPTYPCATYLFRDKLGNEGWFSLGHFNRGTGGQFRASVLLDAIWPRKQMNYRDIFQGMLRVASAISDAVSFRWRPGLNYSEYSRWIIRRNLKAPRAFVRMPKGAPSFPIHALDYDDSDFIAWTFPWRINEA